MLQIARTPSVSLLSRYSCHYFLGPGTIFETGSKTSISLIIADQTFLEELKLAGRHVGLGSLMGAFFVGYGPAIFVWDFLLEGFGPVDPFKRGFLGKAAPLLSPIAKKTG